MCGQCHSPWSATTQPLAVSPASSVCNKKVWAIEQESTQAMTLLPLTLQFVSFFSLTGIKVELFWSQNIPELSTAKTD